MKRLLKGGRVLDPASGFDAKADVAIADGNIVAVGACPDFTADETLDVAGQWVMPGLVDLSARLREPGYEYRATLESEMKAAIAGGVTSLVCPPDTDPVLDEPGLVEMLKFRAQSLNQANVYPLGALTQGLKGTHITEMAELSEAGCIGFSQAEESITDTQVLLRALQYANTFGFTVWLRLGKGVAHAGPYASRIGLSGVPVMAETIALMTIFELMRSTGARVHICRVSSARGLDLIRAAKAEGLRVSCDVSAHHVHLTDMDIGFFDPNARVVPPFRDQRDRDAIRTALADGTVDAICSDHTPVDDDAKLLPFAEAEPGATGLELLLSLVLKWARECDIPVLNALGTITHKAAGIIGMGDSQLQAGARADICVVDANTEWLVSPQNLFSQGRHTPYLGYMLPARVTHTFVNGRLVFVREAAC